MYLESFSIRKPRYYPFVAFPRGVFKNCVKFEGEFELE